MSIIWSPHAGILAVFQFLRTDRAATVAPLHAHPALVVVVIRTDVAPRVLATTATEEGNRTDDGQNNQNYKNNVHNEKIREIKPSAIDGGRGPLLLPKYSKNAVG